jgi:hypothetical protein
MLLIPHLLWLEGWIHMGKQQATRVSLYACFGVKVGYIWASSKHLGCLFTPFSHSSHSNFHCKHCRHDTTLVIHDWGSFIGYQLMWRYPDLMQRTVSFDIGSGGTPNVTYQHVNAAAYEVCNT